MASPDPEIEFNLPNNEYLELENVVDDSTPLDIANATNNSQLHDSSLFHGDHNTHNDQHARSPPYRSAPTPYVPHIKPDTYDGSSNFDQYMSHFKDCAELSAWNDRTTVLILASGLRGPARNFYMSLPDKDRRHYQILVSRLAARFGGSKHSSLWLNKLENRRRNKGESISSLADDLRQLCQKAYVDFDHAAQERLALNQLYKLVSTEMQCRCLDQNCQTLNDAVSVIERYEAVLGTQPPVIRVCDNKINPPQNTDISQTIQRIEARLDRIESSRTYAHKPVSQAAKPCYGCNSFDHLWASCPRNMNPRPSTRASYNTPPRRFDNARDNNNSTYQSSHTFNNQQYRPAASTARAHHAAVQEN